MSEWSVLPNAVHIDRVLESVKTHPEIWDAAWNAAWDAAWDAAWGAAWDAARLAARDAARDAARYAARNAAGDAARNAASDAAWYAARDAAWYAILALIAWDDSAEFLDMTSDELEVWARLSSNPGAILLLPAVRAFEKIRKLETV